jgi:ZIP family zinc transporter
MTRPRGRLVRKFRRRVVPEFGIRTPPAGDDGTVQVFLFAAVAASAILGGAALGAFWDPPKALRASLLAFAAGALVTATTFELFEKAERQAGLVTAATALAVGAAVFIGADWFVERESGGREAVGLALVIAVTLDGVPENLALGVTLEHGGSYALLAAIFASNFPEALGGAAIFRSGNGSGRRAFLLWTAVAVLLAVALVAGRIVAEPASDRLVAVLLAFAAGAVLASIADTVMPEAYAEGGPLVAFATAAGFLLAYALAM